MSLCVNFIYLLMG